MRRTPWLIPLLAVALLLTPATGQAQQKPQPQLARPIEIPAGGFELFRALLDRSGIKPITKQELDSNRIGRWDDVIVILLGDHSRRNLNNDPLNYATNAMRSGGAAFIASDTAQQLGSAWTPTLNAEHSAQINYARVECEDDASVLSVKVEGGDKEAQHDCPYVIPIASQDLQVVPLGKVFEGLTRIATNEPAYLTTSGFAGHFRFPLAKFPKDSIIRTRNQRFRLPDNALFAVGGYGPDGNNNWSYQFLAMADHSVFINQMLIEPGTQNLELTYRIIEYLQGQNKRKRCLLIENGRVIEKFDDLAQAFKNARPAPPTPNLGNLQGKMADIANAMIDKLQTENVANRLLLERFGLPVIVRFFMILAAIYATSYVLRRMFGTRKPTDIPPPIPVAAAATGPPGVFERRQKELIRRDNLYEPIRDMVRDYFASIGIQGIVHGPKLPKLVISDEVRKPESLRHALRDFWRMAYGPPQEVSVRRWRELEPYFERLQQAHVDGKWYFVLANAPVAAAV